MDSSVDTILLTLVIGCLVILILKKNKTSVTRPPRKNKPEKKSLNLQYDPKEIFRVVITGGPCAGKTTGMLKITRELSENIKILIVPEASTMLVKGGANNNPATQDESSLVEFQASLMELQMALEDAFTELASTLKEKTLILCDRGLMDGSAYATSNMWQALLDEKGWTVVHLRDRRYEAAIHLVTAANGAEDYYNLSNNEARYEGLADARKVDKNLQIAWTGHSHLSIIDNKSNSCFDEKLDKLISIVLRYIGAPTSNRGIKKYLLKLTGSIPEIKELQVVKVYLEDTFLKSKKGEIVRIQKRGQSGSFIYTHTVRKKLDQENYSVNKCQITAMEYIKLGSTRDISRKSIKRVRQCFIYNDQYFLLNTYLNVKNGISVLRVETNKSIEDIEVPESIHLLREVTDDPGYSAYIMSKVNWYISSSDRDIILDS